MEPAILLELWERSESATPAERGAAMVRFAGLDPSSITLGGREAALLRLQRELFGEGLMALADCPQCSEAMEVELPIDALSEEEGVRSFAVTADGWYVECRALTAQDLAEVSKLPSVDMASAALLARLVVSATLDGVFVRTAALPESVIESVTGALSELDPLSEIRLSLTCPACETTFDRVLDPPTLLWARLDAWARQMLHEVHVLARAYGWAEDRILAMSQARRTAYLELIGA